MKTARHHVKFALLVLLVVLGLRANAAEPASSPASGASSPAPSAYTVVAVPDQSQRAVVYAMLGGTLMLALWVIFK